MSEKRKKEIQIEIANYLRIQQDRLRKLGENEEDIGVNVYVGKSDKRKLKGFSMVFQYPALAILQMFSYRAILVFVYMVGKSEYGNFVGIDQTSIADHFSRGKNTMSVRTVKRAIKELVDDSVLIKVKSMTDKRRNEYMLNPFASWKGDAKTYYERLKDCEKEGVQLTMNFYENWKSENPQLFGKKGENYINSLLQLPKKNFG